MRFVLISIFSIILLILFTQTGKDISGNFLIGAAFAQAPIVCNVVMEDEEEEEVPEFWEEFFKGNLDDEDADDESYDEEEDEPEEENPNDEEPEDEESEDEWNPDEQGFLDFINQEDVVEEEETEADNPPSDEELADDESTEEYVREPDSMYDDESWSEIPGVKIPFFFLMDPYAPEMDEYLEPKVAHLKALKFADQIINGISFKYNVDSQDVYLAENMTEIPKYIYMVDRFDYAGVSRFNYEVSIPSLDIESIKSGRLVSVTAQMRSVNIASSFEASRKKAFVEAVKKAYIKEKLYRESDKKTEYTGTISAWQVTDEGWKPEEDAFYLRMSIWVAFDE